MSDADTIEEKGPDDAAAAEPVKVKQVAIAAGIVTAALTAAVAFTVAGPLGIGVAAAGVAGTGYTVHRIRNPQKGTLLHSWLTRTRRTRTTTSKGTLSWPFTGNQSRRALSKSGSGGPGRRSGTGRTGSLLPKLSGSTGRKAASGRVTGGSRGPLLPKTTRSRAARSAGGALPKHRAVRPVPSRTSKTPSASKPSGTRAPKTASKTAATPRKSASLTPRGPHSAGGKPVRRSSPKATTPRLTNSRSRHHPNGATGRKPSTPGISSGNRRSGRGRFNPWLGTRGGRSLGGRSTASRRTGRAGRLGGTLGTASRGKGRLGSVRNRLTPDRNRNTSPSRTRLRPRPYARRTTGSLLRTSLRLPVRNRSPRGSRRVVAPFRRPNRTQARRARRTLRLRSGVWLRRGAVWVAKTPARRWDRLWEKLPKAPLPITHYTERSGMKVPTGPKHKPASPAAPVAPQPVQPAVVRDITLTPINRNGEVIYVSNPNDIIREAFQAMAAFEPSSAREVEEWLQQQHETLQAIGQSYGVLADRMRDGMPFAAPVADSVREIGVALASVGGIAQSAHQTLRVAHEADIRRYEDPRPGEDLWNPEKNR